MRNLKATMMFRGTHYHGFQTQQNAVTVQETVERGLSQLLQENVSIFGCSRTDTGVHANQFCFSFHTNSFLKSRNLIRGSAAYLPGDIAITSVEEVPEDFHARYSCKAKEYMYRIHASESANPFTPDLELHYRRPLDIEKMRAAAEHCIGTHDFAAFCTNVTLEKNTIRTIYSITIEREGDAVILKILGNGFLYHMVRILVGTFLEVNEGKRSPDDMDRVLASRDRTCAGMTAGAHGLYLNRVFYDDVIK